VDMEVYQEPRKKGNRKLALLFFLFLSCDHFAALFLLDYPLFL
jgi:hypothetical protein